MTDIDTVGIVFQILEKGIPELVDVVRAAIAGARPDLVPAPPEGEGGKIAAEDESVIARRFDLPSPAAAVPEAP